MKMDLLRRPAMNFAFSVGDALKHGSRLMLYPIRDRTPCNQGFYFCEIVAVLMFVTVVMRVSVIVVVIVWMMVAMRSVTVVTVMMILDKFDLVTFLALLQSQDGGELMRFGQLGRGFEELLLGFEFERLPFSVGTHGFQDQVSRSCRRAGFALGILEVKPEPWRDVRLEHTQLDDSNGSLQQRAAMAAMGRMFVTVLRVMMGMRVRMGMDLVTVTVLMFMLVRVVVMVIVQMNIELRSGDGGLLSASDVKMVAPYSQLLEPLLEVVRIHPQINQRANEHVAADAAENIKVKRFHDLFAASALIWLAAYPAPKPLSMFTTVTPLPQLFNIPSRAATPPKLAP